MKVIRPRIHEIILIAGLLISILSLPYSITICHAGIIIILINWIAQWDWQNKIKMVKQNSALWFFVLFFIAHLIGILYSNDYHNAVFNVEKKFSLLVIPVVLATSNIGTKDKILLYKSFIIACFIASLVCLGGSFYRVFEGIDSSHLNFGEIQPDLLLTNPFFSNQWQEFSYVTLSSVIGIHPTYFAIYIIFSVAILIINRDKVFVSPTISLVLIIYFTAFLALLSTRITIAILLVSLLTISVYSIFMLPRNWFKNLGIGTALVVMFVLLSALNPVSFYREFQEFKSTPIQISDNTQYRNSTEIRLSLWWLGLETAIHANPWIGFGTGSTANAMAFTASKSNISNVLNSNDPHNQYLNTYISLGVVGIALLLACFLAPIRIAWRKKDFLHIAFMCIILIGSFTESFLELQKGIVFFALFQSLFTFQNFSGTGETKFSSI